jgi:C4-dicarboxylate-specific signal transduction histidine kinase
VIAEVDSGQVHQVLTNTIVNGIQAMQHAGTITVGLVVDDSPNVEAESETRRVARIFVEDQGPGIPEQALSRIFEPFFTTKGIGEGTGLGLSVAWGIVHEHGGTIRASNLATGGAQFVLDLPM